MITDVTTARRDWRDVARDATDLALLGILLTVAALPLLTAAAAVGVASAAVRDWLDSGSWPPAGETVHRFRRALLPGAVAGLVTLAGAALLAVDIAGVATGAVPGGRLVLVLTCVVAASLAGFGGLAVVEVGRTGGRGWRAAARAAARGCADRPARWAATTGVSCLVLVLGLLVAPVTVPILLGYALAALHAVSRRLTGRAAAE
ncbi:hypothetical protein K7640_18130 [Micromonospora sp. PLK6-60]|uniref:DUF624 domain-containing protein n=1 Tax=Micromonospora sp. PLK6-60 TaxID=2873383 RepID=UPI001CA61783|nr:hypothetical protein [Micromonospora sp. PLK6-60]MBY8873752.1 hypothetical protein [Micromonospora sp. PLK6-60]